MMTMDSRGGGGNYRYPYPPPPQNPYYDYYNPPPAWHDDDYYYDQYKDDDNGSNQVCTEVKVNPSDVCCTCRCCHDDGMPHHAGPTSSSMVLLHSNCYCTYDESCSSGGDPVPTESSPYPTPSVTATIATSSPYPTDSYLMAMTPPPTAETTTTTTATTKTNDKVSPANTTPSQEKGDDEANNNNNNVETKTSDTTTATDSVEKQAEKDPTVVKEPSPPSQGSPSWRRVNMFPWLILLALCACVILYLVKRWRSFAERNNDIAASI